MYPKIRLRRTRTDSWCRNLVQESVLTTNDLILPIFIKEGSGLKEEIKSMPGIFRYSIDEVLDYIHKAHDLGINAIAIFPVTNPAMKDDIASDAINPDNLICRSIRSIKKKCPDIGIIADVALDPYTSHGHDGILSTNKKAILNDETVEILCKQALIQAAAGCDIVAPSDMMDGRVGAIRDALDNSNFKNVKILSYAVKYASSFYGPFREAIGSTTATKINKSTYQMDFHNSTETIREVEEDIKEGADFVIVKPGMSYLDIIHKLHQRFNIPIFAYQVSGEYSMIKLASEKGYINGIECFYESLVAFKRAGCSAILTYAAIDIAEYLSNR